MLLFKPLSRYLLQPGDHSTSGTYLPCRYPIVPAVVVALCGISLIVLGGAVELLLESLVPFVDIISQVIRNQLPRPISWKFCSLEPTNTAPKRGGEVCPELGLL